MSRQTVMIYLEVVKPMAINILGKLANMNVSRIFDNTMCNYSLIQEYLLFYDTGFLILTLDLFIYILIA